MDFLKAAPEQVVKYIDFLTTFSRNPRLAFAALSTPEATPAQMVSAQLLLYAAYGVGLATLLSVMGAAIGMAPDSSAILVVIGRVDEKLRPVVAAVLVGIVAMVWHALVKAIAWVLVRIRVSQAQPFRGNVAGSINASLAFGAWSLPLFTAVIVGIRIAAFRVTVPAGVFIVAGAMGLVFPVYFVVAFAAAHRESVDNAAMWFAFTVVALFLIFGR